jgi:hypothetical protein
MACPLELFAWALWIAPAATQDRASAVDVKKFCRSYPPVNGRDVSRSTARKSPRPAMRASKRPPRAPRTSARRARGRWPNSSKASGQERRSHSGCGSASRRRRPSARRPSRRRSLRGSRAREPLSHPQRRTWPMCGGKPTLKGRFLIAAERLWESRRHLTMSESETRNVGKRTPHGYDISGFGHAGNTP